MSMPTFLKLLRTASSEVSKQTLFKSRFTHYVPDFFFIFIVATLFVFSGILDLFFVFYLYLINYKPIQATIYLATIVIPGIFEYLSNRTPANCIPNLIITPPFYFIISMIGFHSIFISLKGCAEIFLTHSEPSPKPLTCFTYPVFHISKETVVLIKIYCLVTSALKTIPRLFILSIFLLNSALDKVAAYMGMTLILLNMAIFSLTMAITFPIRPSARVFTSSFCIVFNAFNKFMATMTSCSVFLVIFATLFKSVQFYALLLPVLRWFTWAWPCCVVLRSQKVLLSKYTFMVYFFFLTLFASIIYIHPFESLGQLYYYPFYFLDFIEEICIIYFFTDVSLDSVTEYLCFRIVMIGFLSIFGLLNMLHKYKNEKIRYGCLSYTSVVSGRAEDEQEEEEVEVEVEVEVPKKKSWRIRCFRSR